MHITIADLRQIADLLLAHLEQSGRDTVEIDKDYYWSVLPERRYDPYNQPVEFSMGQLTDDWAELQAMLKGQKQPLGYGLVWLAAIMQAVGEECVE